MPKPIVHALQSRTSATEPNHDCALCPRLETYRRENSIAQPVWFNGPVPSFGPDNARLLIVGLAPGRMGANRTGRPFTADFAGVLLYSTLAKLGLSTGTYQARADDGVELVSTMITNAVRCAPPGNKPTSTEEHNCRPFLRARIAQLPNLKAILTLGDVAKRNVVAALGPDGLGWADKAACRTALLAKGHGAEAQLGGLSIVHSYHCSRLNTNTGRLTTQMFIDVMTLAKAHAGL